MDLRLMMPMIWKDPVRVIPGWDAPSAVPGWPSGGDGGAWVGSAPGDGVGGAWVGTLYLLPK